MATIDTRESLMDAAEILFAQHGLEGTSLRSITARAEVNLASIHYHFGSKEALIQAVFARRIEPINRERLRLLTLAEEQRDPPDLRAVLRAFIRPALSLAGELGPKGKDFMCLAGRMFTLPPEYRDLIIVQFDEVFLRFGNALRSILPHLSNEARLWRFFYVIGTMVMTLAGSDLMVHHSRGAIDPTNVDEATEQMLAFLAAGLQAPDIKPI